MEERKMANRLKFKKNEIIFKEGDEGECMYDILSGNVGIYSSYGTPDQKLLTTLGEDAFFGEMGMIEKLPRSATAVALEETYVNAINENDFSEFLADRPSKALTVLQCTSNRLRKLSYDYVEACAAIAEYVKQEEKGEKPSAELMAKLKKINALSKKKK